MSRATRRAAAETTTDLLGDVSTAPPKTEPATPANKPAKKKTEIVVAEVQKLQVLPAAKPENILGSLMSAIIDPRVDAGKMAALVDIRDKLMREQAHVQFMTAYIEMQAELPSINRDGKIDQGITRSGKEGVKARWATFDNINSTCRPILVKHKMGLLLLPDAGPDGVGIVVRGQLGFVCETDFGKIVHIERCTIPVPNDPTGGKSPPQGIGSALSYGKRYGAIALLNIVTHAPEDADDLDRKGGKRKPAEGEDLSDEQLKKLTAAIEFCGVTHADFCKHYKIGRVEDLPKKMLDEALQSCRDYAERDKVQNGEK